MIRNLRSRSLELQFGIHFTHIVGSVSDGPFIHIQKFPDTVSSHRSRISDHKRRHQLLVELKIYTYDAVIFRQMVAYKRKIAQDDRFLVIRISDFIHELRFALKLLKPLLGLPLERRKHLMDKHFRRNKALAVLHIHELEVHRSSLGIAAVYRHLKFLHVHDLLEPSLVEIL